MLYSALISLTKYVYMLFPLQYSTLKTSLHITFVYVSVPPTLCCCPMFYFEIKKIFTLPSILYTGYQYHSEAEQQWCCIVLTVWESHTQTAVDSCMTKVTSPTTYNHRTISQKCCSTTLLHSHTNTNPTADS